MFQQTLFSAHFLDFGFFVRFSRRAKDTAYRKSVGRHCDVAQVAPSDKLHDVGSRRPITVQRQKDVGRCCQIEDFTIRAEGRGGGVVFSTRLKTRVYRKAPFLASFTVSDEEGGDVGQTEWGRHSGKWATINGGKSWWGCSRAAHILTGI